MSDTINMDLAAVFELAKTALIKNGFSRDQAVAISETVTAAERDRCLSHGLFRIPFYLKSLSNSHTDPTAVPVVSVKETSSAVHVDAKNGYCPLALKLGYEPLETKARSTGIAALAINNATNIAALWPEVEQLAERGLVAFAFTASNAFVAPAGGIKPIYGTNPMAFAWPRNNHPPMVFDQASSACARGEIQLHLRDGKPIPEGWAVDINGDPTQDPAAALAGAQLPFGAHKGAAIALMIELLAGALIGDLFSFEASEKDAAGTGAPFGGEFMIAIDPAHFSSGGGVSNTDPFERAELLFAKILEQDGTRLPSDRRFKARKETMINGVEVDKGLYEAIRS